METKDLTKGRSTANFRNVVSIKLPQTMGNIQHIIMSV